MKITKYEHACVTLEEQGKKVIIDPGDFTPTFGELANTVAVVVTHVHPDHFAPGSLQKIIDANPQVKIFTTNEVAEQFQKPNVSVVVAGQTENIGPFKLTFRGELHAVIHPDFSRNKNTGVLVNDSFYYPGDSFTLPEQPVNVLAIPASAPWLKMAETIDFLRAVKPKACFPTHDALLSERGHATFNKWIGQASEHAGIGFGVLQPGQSMDS
ncbi:MAG TPA: MBL fold metallo-hydrolase [Nevskiaceae bacterium]|nr:MBL fold metallo-hydrolase [Nevskiaceae bacterium]